MLIPILNAYPDFKQYINDTQAFLLQSNELPRTREEILLNLPFEKKANPDVPYQGQFLLIHGLNDSPFVWHDVTIDLVQRGFDVKAILLPGHGTTPKHMINIQYEKWLDVVRTFINDTKNDASPLYLGGFSLGGVIATIIANEDSDIAGLLLFSPAYHSKLNNTLRWAGVYKYFKTWLFDTMLIEDNPAKYNSIAINSGHQYFKTTQYLKEHWKKPLSIPVLFIVSEDDSVVDLAYTRHIFNQKFTSKTKSLVIYSASNNLRLAPQEIHRNSYHPKQRILNQSHLSLMNNQSNPLFGQSRKVLICNGNEYPIFMACLQSKEHWYGAQHTISPDGIAVARSTYNPDYNFIFEQFDKVFLN